MKSMAKILAVVAVVGVVALGPTAAMAAPGQGGASSITILNVFAKLLGLQPTPVSKADTGKARRVQSPSTSPSGSGNVSTDSAVWGRCLLNGTC